MAIDPKDFENIKDDAAEIGSILNSYIKQIQKSANIVGKTLKDFKVNSSETQKLADRLKEIDKDTLSSSKERKTIENQIRNTQKEINKLQTERKNIASQLINATEDERKELLKILSGYDDLISLSSDLISNTERLSKLFVDIEKNLGLTGNLLEGINKIPILNKFVDVKKALEAANKEASSLSGNRWTVLGAALKSLGQSLKQNLTDPLVYISAATKFFKELVDLGFTFSQRTADIARNFGISSKEALILNQRLSDITLTSKNVLLTQKSLLEATTQINGAFGTSALLTERTLAGQIDLTKRLGLTGEEAAVYAEYSLRTGKSQEQIVNSIGKQNKGILNNKKVIQDVAKVNGQLYAQYKGSPDEIAKAVIQVQKLGMTLEQAKNISKGLLDFESSIANELSAELITGIDLNLEKARYLALMGDSAGAAKELMKNLGPNGLQKFQNMNVIAQESLAKAFGMSADELTNALRTQQMLSKLGKEDKTAYTEAIEAARKKGDLDRASALEKQMNQGKEFKLADQQLSAQERFNSAVEKMKGLLASIVEGPLGKMAETIAKMIEGIGKIPGISKILGYAAPIAAVIGGGLFISSLTRGSILNPTWVRSADGYSGNNGGGTSIMGGKEGIFSRFKNTATKFKNAAKGGGVKGLMKSIGRTGKSFFKGAGKGAGLFGILGSLGLDLAEGGLNWESLGRAGLGGLGSLIGGGIGSLIAPGAGTIGGGIAGGLAGNWLGNKIFGERETIPTEPETELAKGGVITKRTVATVGEAGPEAVIPLNQLMNEFKAMRDILNKIANKEGIIYFDTTKVGTAMTVGTYKLQ